MPRIFMSYRRSDSISESGRIHDHLEREFSGRNIFKDVDDIPPGYDFRKVLDDEVAKCDVLLVIIGPDWTEARDDNGKFRLHNPDDFVRIEVESGLRRGDEVLVIPVLIKNATMPLQNQLPESLHELTYRNAVIIRNDPDFNRDMHRLIDYIRRYGKSTRPTVSRNVIGGGVAIVALLVIGLLAMFLANNPSATFVPTIASTEAGNNSTKLPTPTDISMTKNISSDIQDLYDEASELAGNADYPEAIDLYDDVIEADDTYAPAYLGRALAYASGYGDYSEAIDDLEEAVLLDSSYGEAYRYLGYYQFLEEELDDVESNLLRAIELNPSDVDARMWLAEYYVNAGDYSSAENQYDTLLTMSESLDPDQLYDTWIDKANIQSTLGDDDDAVTSYENAIEINPERSEAYANMGNVQVYLGNYEDAIPYLDTAIDKVSDNADYFYNRGLAHLELQNYTDAMNDFDRSLQLDSNYSYAYVGRGQVYHALGEYESALADYHQAIRRDDTYGDAYYLRGLSHFESGNYELAIDAFSTALGMDAFVGESYAYHGLSYQRLGNDELAKLDFDIALDYDLNDDLKYDVLTESGWISLSFEDSRTALELFSEAIALNPSLSSAYDGEANVFTQVAYDAEVEADAINNWLSAVESLSRGLDNAGDDADLYLGRGIANLQLGYLRDDNVHFELAFADFEKVIELDDTIAITYAYLAELALELDNYTEEDALNYATTAYELDSLDAYILGILAMVHETMGNTDQAIEFYQLAIDTSDDDDDRDYYQEQLEALNGS